MSVAYFNGNFIESDEPALPIEERGHQFGDGVYEVMRIYNGVPFMLDEHLDRLYQSATAIKLPLQQDRESLKHTISELMDKSGLTNLVIYLQVTRGIASRDHLFPDCPVSVSMTAKPFREPPAEARENGVSVMLHPDERWENCYIKSLNLLPNILAKQAAYEKGCFEAILVRDGKVTEGTSSNVYMVKDGSILTTPLSNRILPGITRMAVKQIAGELHIPFVEAYFTPEDMLRADEVFITSTTSEIMPVVRINDEEINSGEPGPVARALYEQLKTMIQRF
ncbi:D-amino-acid transaminase [Paenibacillus beijingensis]|uniref:D-alanine aminotransferase n=1 Tax=Paenibacillus beijingensis TaxID=1126833 RepID=A0A0D5NNX8_9BACL|nr:D-amino-acid transaminase [Paenibacillus beijingensis]AJY76976.1 amino acid aminotransferase [Paenibacillus beijingensis]